MSTCNDTCCKTTNLLRRDGTSQRQRFPITLSEDYVRIDERSHADILNFIYNLAAEFNYYAGDNTRDGDWRPFFAEDLSWVLARTVEVDVEAYRSTFNLLYRNLEFATPPSGAGYFAELDAIFRFFVEPTHKDLDSLKPELEPLPQLLGGWIKLLPESALYDSTAPYTFLDLVMDARTRLHPVMRKIQLAQKSGTTTGSGMGYCTDLAVNWAQLEGLGWNLESVQDANTIYFTSAQDPAEFVRVRELLKASLDTFLGIVLDLQSRMPQYLEQSLSEFPWHNPQNGLVLSFIQLFDHARNHLNTLTRRHLLYEYMDVLRFTRRPLTPDEAVVVLQLRKGLDRYRLEAGTLMKAGKDIAGNPMAYAVSRETVVNQAVIRSLKSVFVERDGEQIVGVYASPVANSFDGLGAALPEVDPKWNLFGEAQLSRLPGDRTMPDARLGFAVASPLLVMKEGQRTIDVTFLVPASQLPPKGADYSAWERLTVTLRNGLRAEYTGPKGWGKAKISEVQVIDDVVILQNRDLAVMTAVEFAGKVMLHFRVELDEGDEPFVVYQEKVHQSGMATQWPVLTLSLQGPSDDYMNLPIPLAAYGSGTVGVSNKFRLNAGKIYDIRAIPSEVEGFDAFWEIYRSEVGAVPYSPGFGVYSTNSLVIFDGGVYRALVDVDQTTGGIANQNPYDYPYLWRREFRTHIYEHLYRLEPQQMLLRVAVEGAYGLVYENDFGKLKGEKPFPMFGGAPVIGSRFYIGSQEIFGKHLDRLDIDILWQDPPDNLGRHYEGYESVAISMQTIAESCGGDCICCIPSTIGSDTESNDTPAAGSGLRQAGPLNPGGPGFLTGDSSEGNGIATESGAEAANGGGTVEVPDDQLICYTICTPNNDLLLHNANWTADIHFLYDGNWELLGEQSLFEQDANGNGARTRHKIRFLANNFIPFERDLSLAEHARLESNTPRGFIRFELKSPIIAFGHKYYKDLYVKAVHESMRTIPPGPLAAPNEPYTPVVKEIRLHYVSRTVVDNTVKNDLASAYGSRVEQYFHLHPFGHTEEHAYLNPVGQEVTLLPSYLSEGSLYVGIEDLQTPSNLSVLYQLAEGSGNSDLPLLPAKSSLLNGNQWQALQRRDILLDTTDELITSGVVQYDFGAEFVNGSTMINRSLHWLRIQVESGTLAYMKGIDILAQAVLVNFHDRANDPQHLEKALPAGRIVGLEESSPSVKRIVQPFASYGGKLPETGDTFITRVSERLRHKQRGINIWDYERMVLEEFPTIYKVKCLNHTEFRTAAAGRGDWELSPGHVILVCIPDLRNVNAVNPFEPKTSIRTLQQVDKYLHRHVSAWVDLKVTNPHYEAIRVTCKIGFKEGKDPGYYTQALERAIQEYLSPWAFDHEQEIMFGGKVHRSKVIQLIEQQEYVDFVLNFQMDHLVDGEEHLDVLEAVASSGRSILVSSLSHRISSVKPDCAHCLPAESVESDCGCCADEAPGIPSTN